MSKCSIKKISCPNCGKESDFKMWDSINTMLDPEMKEKILNRKAFMFHCPLCDTEAFVDYGFLYHQMEDEIMIYYMQNVTEDEINNVRNFMFGKDENGRIVDAELPVKMGNYRHRIVKTFNQLIDKIYIFDAGYDDRIVEIMKVFLYAQIGEDKPDAEVDEILFAHLTEEGQEEDVFYFLNNGKFVASSPFNNGLYQKVAENYKDIIDEMSRNNLIFDFDWAFKAIKKG